MSNKDVIANIKKENSPHFEDISFINNKSNTYNENEASSFLETIAEFQKEKEPIKVPNFVFSPKMKENNEEIEYKNYEDVNTPVLGKKLNDKKNSVFALDNQKTTEKKKSLFEIDQKDSIDSLMNRKTIDKIKNVPEIENIENKPENEIVENKTEILANEPLTDKDEAKNSSEKVNDLDFDEIIKNSEILTNTEKKNFDHTEPINLNLKITEQELNFNSDIPANDQYIPNISDSNLNSATTNETSKGRSPNNNNQTNKTQAIATKVKPIIIDKGSRQRKEEFEKKMRERQTTENKLHTLKQKFQTNPIKDHPNEESIKKTPLTPKENNIPEVVNQTTNFDALDDNLKKKLAELQKISYVKEKNEAITENLQNNLENQPEQKSIISLKDYRNNLKKTGVENFPDKLVNQYYVNSKGHKINKNLSSIINELERKLTGVYGGEKENIEVKETKENMSVMEHPTMERSKIGHRRIKSKNSDFFNFI